MRQASNCRKVVPEASYLSLSRNLAVGTFGKLLIVFSICYTSSISEVLSSTSDKAKLFAKNFLKDFNLNDSVIYLPAFSSITNLKLYNIHVTQNFVEKGHNQSWLYKGIWSCLHSSDGSKKLWAWTFIHTSWNC